MPNHIHLIISINDSDSLSVPTRFIASDKNGEGNDAGAKNDAGARNDAMNRVNTGAGNAGARNAGAGNAGAGNAGARNGGATGAHNIMNKQSLGTVIRGMKSRVTKYANENGISFAWHSRYHDHIIRNHGEMNRIAQYIINNPIVWESKHFYM